MTMNIAKDHVRYYSLARQALVDALLLGGVRDGDRVLVPGFICKDVVASIHTVRATPVFYQVDELLAPINLRADESIKAIIAVNYFGFPQNLDAFKRESLRFGALLIEDNAHGFLSSDTSNSPLGTRGDLGIISIRKSLRIPDGAQLLVNDQLLLNNIPQQIPYVRSPLGFRFTAQKLALKVQRITRLPLLEWARYVVRKIRLISTGSALPISPPSAEFESITPTGPRDSSMSSIQSLDIAHEINRRKHLYHTVSSLVSECDIQPVFESLPINCVPYGYPFYADSAAAADVYNLVKKLGIEVINWPDLPASVIQTAPIHYRQLWLVNFL
jgi:hypothetical protein